MKKLMYFAHCILEYHTDIEKYLVSMLDATFNDEYEILNPKILAMKEMSNYVKIARACDALVFHPFEEQYVLSGVAKEIRSVLSSRKPIYCINHAIIQRLKSLEKIPLGTPIIRLNELEGFSGLTIIENVDETRELLREKVASGKYSKPTWWT